MCTALRDLLIQDYRRAITQIDLICCKLSRLLLKAWNSILLRQRLQIAM